MLRTGTRGGNQSGTKHPSRAGDRESAVLVARDLVLERGVALAVALHVAAQGGDVCGAGWHGKAVARGHGGKRVFAHALAGREVDRAAGGVGDPGGQVQAGDPRSVDGARLDHHPQAPLAGLVDARGGGAQADGVELAGGKELFSAWRDVAQPLGQGDALGLLGLVGQPRDQRAAGRRRDLEASASRLADVAGKPGHQREAAVFGSKNQRFADLEVKNLKWCHVVPSGAFCGSRVSR